MKKNDHESSSDGENEYAGLTGDEPEEVYMELTTDVHTFRTITVDFEAYPFLEIDQQGIGKLLSQLFADSNINADELASQIVKQKEIGCIIKPETAPTDEEGSIVSEPCVETAIEQLDVGPNSSANADDAEDESDVYGFVSALPVFTKQADHLATSVKQLEQYLTGQVEKHSDPKFKTAFASVRNSGSTPLLLLNQRLINLPFQVASPCFQSLIDDLKKISSPPFCYSSCHHFLALLSIHKSDIASTQSRKKSKRSKVGTAQQQSSEILFTNPEEELLCEAADVWFDYPVKTEAEDSFKAYRRMVLLSKNGLESFVEKLKCGETGEN